LDDSAAPLYVRLKEALSDLMGADLSVGDQLPSEIQLMDEYAVSRTTVRLALGALANEGLIVRRQGKGSFVAQPKRDVPYLGSLTKEMAAQGRSLSTVLISFDALHPTPRVAQLLEVGESEMTYKIRRVRLVEREPICYQVTYLPVLVFPDLSKADVESGSLHQLLRARLDGSLDSADESVEALLADPYRASLLEVAAGTPLLLIQRVSYDAHTRPTALTRSFYCGNAVRLQLGTHLPPDASGFRVALRTHELIGLTDD